MTTLLSGLGSCSECDIGKYGNDGGFCTACNDTTHQSEKGQTQCVPCPPDHVPDAVKTGCTKIGVSNIL
jgi:hypothetical protein